MLRNTAYATALFACLSTASYADQASKAGNPIVLPKVDPGKMKLSIAAPAIAYPNPVGKSGKTYTVERTSRGSSVTIPEADIIQYCSDKSGCTVRIGMHNWDDKGRVASRHFLFFYNKDTGVWRSEAGDIEGTNNNNATEHVFQAWSCYFTDGQYQNWQDKGDTSKDFGLLSWNQYNADCFLTLMP
ncbi:hypothetical protein NLM16_05930 [Bradyrhizobium brasilense]|uniref:hypothetical protein n=1 Tax=Bradyrhizobium brasilense TaxID=1419277 RepID=UPI002877E0EE|nr:hypothetical protein [Bradyrhizobium brasilense]MCP3413634.1 hypothetical protein [Bradyrhizobium brasilense]